MILKIIINNLVKISVIFQPFKKSKEGKQYIPVSPGFSDPEWFGEGAGIVLQKGNIQLKEKIDQAIQNLRDNGTYDTIQDKYFDYNIYGE